MVLLEDLGHSDRPGRAELTVGADADLQLVAHRVPDGFEDLRGMLDGLQRKVAGQGEVGHEGVDLAGGVAFLDQFLGDVAGLGRVFPDAFGGHVRVGAQFLVAASSEQVVDRLVGGFADDVPKRHLDGRQRRRAVQARVPVVVVRGVRALPDGFDLERAVADHEAAGQVVQQRDLGGEIGRMPGGSFTEAGDTFVGEELDEQPLPAAAERRDVVEKDRLDSGDFHCRIS